MTARRVLLTGVSGPLGARVAGALAADPNVDHIVGIDSRCVAGETVIADMGSGGPLRMFSRG